VAALALQREHGGGLCVLGAVLKVIDPDGLARTSPRHKGAIWLLHDDGGPTVVVPGLPEREPARFRDVIHLRTLMFGQPRHCGPRVVVVSAVVDREAEGTHSTSEQDVRFDERVTLRSSRSFV